MAKASIHFYYITTKYQQVELFGIFCPRLNIEMAAKYVHKIMNPRLQQLLISMTATDE